MVAGANTKVTIWRMDTDDDDSVGGAVITGTSVYTHINIRFQAEPEQQLLLQQGLQTMRTFTAMVVPGYLDIRERDELEVTAPIDHIYYGKRFRITSVSYSSHNRRDPRNYIRLGLIRSVRAHEQQ
jgi:hypothetical protein